MITRQLIFIFTSLLIINTAYAAETNSRNKTITKVLVEKSERKLHLLHNEQIVNTYKIALGGSPVGHKTQEGDNRTPEGSYVIDWRNAHSQFYKSLHISYPNILDKKQAAKRNISPGGAIFIHGLGKGFGAIGKAHSLHDWTLGCIAVSNEEIDEIWELVENGTPIEINP